MWPDPPEPHEEMKYLIALVQSLKLQLFELKSKVENPSLNRTERMEDLKRIEEEFAEIFKTQLIKTLNPDS